MDFRAANRFVLAFCGTLLVAVALVAEVLVAEVLGSHHEFPQHAFPEQEAYLDARGLMQHARQLEQKLLSEPKRPATPVPREASKREKRAAFKAFHLAIHGLTVEAVERLEGASVAPSLGNQRGPSLARAATTTDLVAVGRVERYVETPAPRDGFRSSIVIEVLDVLKGAAPDGEVAVLRQRSGRTASGAHASIVDTGELGPVDVGRTYLFFLSNARYRYEVFRTGSGQPPMKGSVASSEQRYFVGSGVLMRDGELTRLPGYHRPWPRRALHPEQRVFDEIRQVDRLLTTDRREAKPSSNASQR